MKLITSPRLIVFKKSKLFSTEMPEKKKKAPSAGELILNNGEILHLLGPIRTPEAYAHRIWAVYNIAKQRIRDRYYDFYHKNTPSNDKQVHLHPDMLNRSDFEHVRKIIVSASQGNKSLMGGICNRLIEIAYGDLFSHTNPQMIVESNHNLGANTSSRRRIDVFMGTHAQDTYISITTTPRERKMGDWFKEYQELSTMNLGKNKRWQFIGLAFDWSSNSRKANVRELPQGMSTVSVEDIEHHAEFLSNLGQSLW